MTTKIEAVLSEIVSLAPTNGHGPSESPRRILAVEKLTELLKDSTDTFLYCLGGVACKHANFVFDTSFDSAGVKQALDSPEVGVDAYWRKFEGRRTLMIKVRPPEPTYRH